MKLRYLLSLTICAVSICSSSLFGTPAGSWTAYITNNQSGAGVTPLETATNTPGTPNPIPFPSGTQLAYIAITPDGTTAYATAFTVNALTPIDTATNTVGTPITLPSIAQAIAITPNGMTIYLTSPDSSSVIPVDVTTQTVGTPIFGFSNPTGIAITPDGTRAYVVNQGSNTVTLLDLATGTPETIIPVGESPFQIAITPDGKKAYVANAGSNTVTPIDITSNIPGSPIDVLASKPQLIAITPDGTKAYVTNFDSNNVTPIDLTTGTAAAPIAIGGGPVSIAITPDGTTAYINLFDFPADEVVPLDIATNTAGTPINISTVDNPPPLQPLGIAITPDQAPTASFTYSDAPTITSPTFFDASSSSSPVGIIASYAWDFGDGTSLTTASPTTSHTYNLPGNYTVTLVVINSAGTSTHQVFTGQTVSQNGGISAKIRQDITVAQPAPTVSGISPSFGPTTGGSVMITGTGLMSANQVMFGGVATSFQFIADTVILAIAPPGTGIVDVTVTTPSGTSPTTPADQYMYVQAPSKPLYLKGKVVKIAIQYLHLLWWQPSTDPSVTAYELSRNCKLIATIPAGAPTSFIDYNGCQNHYTLVAVNVLGLKSEPVKLELPPKNECECDHR